MKKRVLLLSLVLAMLCAGWNSFAETAEESLEAMYRNAQLLLSRNRFAEAAEAFSELGGYEESARLAMYCKAADAGENGNYNDAFDAFEALGDFKDSRMMLTYYHGRMYEHEADDTGKGIAACENLYEAVCAYRSVLFFRDSHDRAESCKRRMYEIAMTEQEAGDLSFAVVIFRSLGEYRDAAGKTQKIEEQLALQEKSRKEAEIAELCPDMAACEESGNAEALIAVQDQNINPRITQFLVCKDTEGNIAGYAVFVDGTGFGGPFSVGIGYTPEGTIRKIAFRELNETMGLGMNADKDEFKDQFIGKQGELTLVHYGAGDNDQEINAVTGATITSTAVVNAVNAGTGFLTEVTGTVKGPVFSDLSSETKIVATADGFVGQVTVKLCLLDGTVTDLAIEAPDEIIGRLVSDEAFTSQFIGKKGPFTYGEDGIDAVSGATVTSRAVLDAINQAYAGIPEDALVEVTDGTMVLVPESREQDGGKTQDEPEPAGNGNIAPAGYYGSFTAERETPFSVIRVYIDITNGEISSCRIVSEGKAGGADFLTDEIRNAWAEAIVENGTAETDAITGATLIFSREAVADAVHEILSGIGK